MVQPSRKFDAGNGYRYGFNGKEKDNSTGEGNLDFGARIMDVRLGRWLSIDALVKKYPSVSPYVVCSDNPIGFLDIDGMDFILGTVRYTYDGAVIPTSVHQLGNTSLDPTRGGGGIALTYNTTTGEYDFTVNTKVQFSSNFTGDMNDKGGGSLEQKNPGLFREVKGHEKGHVNQYFEAAKKNVTISLSIDGVTQRFTNRADKILTKLKNDFEVKLNAEVATKQANGDFAARTPQESDALKQTYILGKVNDFKQNVLNIATEKVYLEMSKNLKKTMDPKGAARNGTPAQKASAQRAATELENDANRRSAAELGAGTIKYNNGATPIKSNTGSGAILSY